MRLFLFYTVPEEVWLVLTPQGVSKPNHFAASIAKLVYQLIPNADSSGTSQVHIHDPGQDIRTDQTDHNAFHQDKYAGGNGCQVMAHRHSLAKLLEEIRTEGQKKDHEDCEAQHAYHRSIHAHSGTGNMITYGIRVLGTELPDGKVHQAYMDHTIKDAQVVAVAEPQQVHKKEEQNKADHHPKAISESYLLHTYFYFVFGTIKDIKVYIENKVQNKILQ